MLFFPVREEWQDNRFLAIPPVSGRELRDFSSWNTIKVSDFLSLPQLGRCPDFGSELFDFHPMFCVDGRQMGSCSYISVSPSLWWARASFPQQLLQAELPRVCQALGAGCKGKCGRNVLVEKNFVVLSLFLLNFRVAPCEEYLKESKALQTWRKALSSMPLLEQLAELGLAGLCIAVWAKGLRL